MTFLFTLFVLPPVVKIKIIRVIIQYRYQQRAASLNALSLVARWHNKSYQPVKVHLVGVETPELELLLKQRTAHVGRVVQLPGPIVVEYLREDARMSVEEVLVEYRVVVGERLGEAGQPSGGDLLQRRLVCLVTDAADVDGHAVLSVAHRRLVDNAPCYLLHSSQYTAQM